MSWAAHEFETYFIQRHIGARASYLAIVLGSFAPDLFTKFFVYSAEDPAQFHRGWPGVGFSHSLIFGVALAAVVLLVARSRGWAFGLLIGQWAHVLTDVADTAGVMLFFPFSTEPVSISMWKHAAVLGRYGDGSAYYSSLGGVWDLLWLVVTVLFARNVLATCSNSLGSGVRFRSSGRVHRRRVQPRRELHLLGGPDRRCDRRHPPLDSTGFASRHAAKPLLGTERGPNGHRGARGSATRDLKNDYLRSDQGRRDPLGAACESVSRRCTGGGGR